MTGDRSRLARARRFHREERGTSTIEFVVLMPLFLVALAFVFEFGRFFIAYQVTANNVRSAARYIAQVDLSEDNEIKAENIIRTGRVNGKSSDAPNYLANLCNPNTSIEDGDCIIRADRPIRIEVRVDFPLTIFRFMNTGGKEATLPFRVVEYVHPVGS
jgi:hypothetical protein